MAPPDGSDAMDAIEIDWQDDVQEERLSAREGGARSDRFGNTATQRISSAELGRPGLRKSAAGAGSA